MISIVSSFPPGIGGIQAQGCETERGIAILGYWTPAIPAGVTDHFELT